VLAVAAATLLVSLPLVGLRFWNTPEAAGVEMEPAPEGGAAQGDDRPAMTTREILSQLPFWLFSISLALFIAVYTSTVFNLGLHFADRGLTSGQASTLMPLVAVGGIAGKLGFGALADRVPLKLAFVAAIGVTATALAILLVEPGYSALLATMLLLGIATGGLLPVWNALVPRLFGLANFGRTMGLMGPVISLTTMSVYPLVGSVRDATGSYAAVFQGDLVALAVAVAVVIPLREGRG
jgi:MFS family permease